MYKNDTNPAQIISGPEELSYNHAISILQSYFCKQSEKNIECFCRECRKLKDHQHPFVVWTDPEKEYTVSDIQIIFDRIRFTLEKDQAFFFVINKAEALSPTCANRLLKTLEEPPPGYHFILLTNNEMSILPTIRSRCIVHICKGEKSEETIDPLLEFFYPRLKNDPAAFEQTLKNANLSNRESIELVYKLIELLQQKLVSTYEMDNIDEKEINRLKSTITFLAKVMKTPPQSGSSNIFWKYVYMAFPI
jgi:DNA polymerase III gamma/tau subunit